MKLIKRKARYSDWVISFFPQSFQTDVAIVLRRPLPFLFIFFPQFIIRDHIIWPSCEVKEYLLNNTKMNVKFCTYFDAVLKATVFKVHLTIIADAPSVELPVLHVAVTRWLCMSAHCELRHISWLTFTKFWHGTIFNRIQSTALSRISWDQSYE